jgi:hypothetical protein
MKRQPQASSQPLYRHLAVAALCLLAASVLLVLVALWVKGTVTMALAVWTATAGFAAAFLAGAAWMLTPSAARGAARPPAAVPVPVDSPQAHAGTQIAESMGCAPPVPDQRGGA